jgi:L-methionine (R)-S-oxide reductase
MAKTNYKQMDASLRETLRQKSYLMGNLANASAIIKKNMDDVNWVGFYLLNKDEMFLGPFQGDVAKTRFPLYKGLMGKAMQKYKTQVDNNFAACPCDDNCEELTKSEIVVPIFYNREPVGVLDISSASENRFSDKDVEELEKIAFLIQKVWRHMY